MFVRRADLTDLGVALALTGVQAAMLAVESGSVPFAGWMVLVASTLVLSARRRRPLLTWLLAMAGTVVYGLSPWPDPPLYLGALFAIFTAASRCPPRESAAVAGVSLALAMTAWLVDPADTDANDLLAPVLGVTAAWAAGHAVAAQRSIVALLTERNEQLERERQEREVRALEQERLRIARDLHDITAHHVSVISVQAEAARMDPATQADALAAIATSASGAMAELRRMLGVLRGVDGGPTHAQPGIADLDHLVQAVRSTSLDVELVVEGLDGSLDDDIGLAVHRIVQEALTNVVRHAEASKAAVRVAAFGDRISVVVEDDGSGSSTPLVAGYGLQGIRERAARYGGSVEAGPGPEGGFRIEAELRP